ncbi:MAG: histidine kinase [Lachnospiraceae bacterium]|nr:histidine kinase [Lachnospiraceae bacterium]
MRRINTEIKRNYLLFGLCLALFVAFNAFVTGNFIRNYTELLDEYRLVNDMAVSYNDSKTYFHLYMKQHETENKNQYEKASEKTISILDGLYEAMQRDRDCTMIYRIVHQMLEHRQDKILAYMDPAIPTDQGGTAYIENLDLLIDGNMNLLNSYYLEYISGVFSSYSGNLRTLTTVVNIALLVMGFFSFFINTAIYRDMLKSVEKLTVAAQEIKDQNFDTEDIADTPYVEMNFVIRTFNEMKHTIHDMIQEINKNFEIRERLAEQVLENERQERRLAESKMKELQMQINPHFLFNTLSLVMRSIQLDDKEISIQLIKSISKILRSSIEIRSTSVPIDDEIELLESYLYIQRVHCKGRIAFQLDIRKSYMDDEIEVPPLIIQPLIENAIQHGLKNTVKDGKVSISIIEKASCIEVMVTDNGTGMPAEILDNLKQHVQTRSIGLYNVIERLRLRYHRDDVVTIDSGEGGTKITLFLYKEMGTAYD